MTNIHVKLCIMTVGHPRGISDRLINFFLHKNLIRINASTTGKDNCGGLLRKCFVNPAKNWNPSVVSDHLAASQNTTLTTGTLIQDHPAKKTFPKTLIILIRALKISQFTQADLILRCLYIY